mmetsp:Transcript_39588/g.97982  ORF Transcript_39588/g.97982 Transcript_39588/m.97982 type:complete len:254 (+) Transcript_39588:980-1741(+)
MLLLGVLGLLAAAIGAAHGLAVLLVAVVHGLALVVERVAQEVEAVRRRVLRVVEAEAGRALHGGGARCARDIGVPHVRVARVLHRAVRLDALHEVVHEPRQTVRLAHRRRAEEGPQREHAVRVAADAELGRAARERGLDGARPALLRHTGAEVVLEDEHAEAGRVARRGVAEDERAEGRRRVVPHLETACAKPYLPPDVKYPSTGMPVSATGACGRGATRRTRAGGTAGPGRGRRSAPGTRSGTRCCRRRTGP